MMNKKLNLSLPLNKSFTSFANEHGLGPFTPLDQTMKTPLEPPSHFPGGGFNLPYIPPNQQQQQQQPPPQSKDLGPMMYQNARYNESDDILTDIDEPSFGSFKTTRNYTLTFTPTFDSLVLSVYSSLVSAPTTTPFSGNIPPSGLVSKVANETMNSLIRDTSRNDSPVYDYQSILNPDYLRNHMYQPIFLQLIRKRFIDLCTFNNSTSRLPSSTTISVSSSGGNANTTMNNSTLRQSSISNLSLSELNLSNDIQNQNSQSRSRSSSTNLRKHSLTRNNSHNGGNWLHVGNLNNLKPHILHESGNQSTDSLQSMQDFVPQALINRSANGSESVTTPTGSSNGINLMMSEYQTPPSSNKGSISHSPPFNIQIVQGTSGADLDDFNFYQQQKSVHYPKNGLSNSSLTIDTDHANQQALNALNGDASNDAMLESPFMSATTPSDEHCYFSNGFTQNPNGSDISIHETSLSNDCKKNFGNQFSLSEKKRDSLKLKRGIH